MIIHPPSEITVAQLFEAYYDCRRNKRTTRSALSFEVNLENNLMELLAELRAFIKSIQTREKPLADAWSGYHSVRVLDAALRSAKAGSRVSLK